MLAPAPSPSTTRVRVPKGRPENSPGPQTWGIDDVARKPASQRDAMTIARRFNAGTWDNPAETALFRKFGFALADLNGGGGRGAVLYPRRLGHTEVEVRGTSPAGVQQTEDRGYSPRRSRSRTGTSVCSQPSRVYRGMGLPAGPVQSHPSGGRYTRIASTGTGPSPLGMSCTVCCALVSPWASVVAYSFAGSAVLGGWYMWTNSGLTSHVTS